MHNSSLSDPERYISQTRNKLTVLYTLFKSVCDIGVSSICPQAMNHFETIALKVLKNIDSVTINQSLDRSTVAKFEGAKSKIRSVIRSMINSSFRIAYGVTSSGLALPETTQETLWRKGLDWNFEPISSSAGAGYVKWTMKANQKGK